MDELPLRFQSDKLVFESFVNDKRPKALMKSRFYLKCLETQCRRMETERAEFCHVMNLVGGI